MIRIKIKNWILMRYKSETEFNNFNWNFHHWKFKFEREEFKSLMEFDLIQNGIENIKNYAIFIIAY